MASRLLRFLPLAVLGWACSTGPSNVSGSENLGRSNAAIINGVLDTTHPAVVALLLGEDGNEGACTGTIVKRDLERHIGWVATAAHCLESGASLAIQSQDYASSDYIQYSVIDFEADPLYSTGREGHDFGVIRIGGVDESTPVIPLATDPDNLVRGMDVTSVGFGMTAESDFNTTRQSVTKPLNEVTANLLGYEQATSGICFGDSGGPVIAGSGGSERVVGIHSFGTSALCVGQGYSARVTSGLDFFEQQLNKVPEPSCALCEKIAKGGAGKCARLIESCLNDAECSGYYKCIADGKKEAAECFAEFPISEGPFLAGTSCVCHEACADVCAGDSSCAAVPKCGDKLDEADACSTCIESSCCEELRDCTADGRCHLCLKRDDSFGSCKRNTPRQALATCAANKCSRECAGSTLPTIGQPTEEADAGPPPAATEPASGCSAAPSSAPTSWRLLAFAGVALGTLVHRRRRGPR
jgi:MYXO-CTERM domain-containing protein